jgi:lipopolysaccharide biosynthesis glycosyltransferase
MFHVAYCFDRNFAQYFGASVFSLILNYRGEPSELLIHLVSEDFDADLLEKIEVLRSTFRVGIRTYAVADEDLRYLSGLPLPVDSHFSRANYFRLLLPSILDAEIRRALYLDSDTIILDDISELLAKDIEGRAVGAVNAYSSDIHAKRLNLEYAVNSGVMIMDLAQWRSRDVHTHCFRWLVEHPELAQTVDQDAINVILSDSVFLLDPKWNFRVKSGEHIQPTDPVIIHYIGPTKPWHEWYDNEYGNHYWHYAQTCPWKASSPLQPRNVHELYNLACLRMKQSRYAEARHLYEGVYKALLKRLAQRNQANRP